CIADRLVQRGISMQIIVPEKLLVLLVTYTGIDKNEPVALLYQKAAHSPGAHVVFIRRIKLAPHTLGHYTMHGATIELEQSCIYCVQIHSILFLSVYICMGWSLKCFFKPFEKFTLPYQAIMRF